MRKILRIIQVSTTLSTYMPDPDPSLGIEAVISIFASTYPEITTAAVNGPEVVDGKQVYTLQKAIGTKG